MSGAGEREGRQTTSERLLQRLQASRGVYVWRWATRALLAAYAAFVLMVTLRPRLEDLGTEGIAARVLAVLYAAGVPQAFDIAMLEFTMNVAMFVPLGVLLGCTLPVRRLPVGVVLIPLFSAAIELSQLLFLADRVADVRDVIANSLGGWIGLVIVLLARRSSALPPTAVADAP